MLELRGGIEVLVPMTDREPYLPSNIVIVNDKFPSTASHYSFIAHQVRIPRPKHPRCEIAISLLVQLVKDPYLLIGCIQTKHYA
jgi:hypothetical protein